MTEVRIINDRPADPEKLQINRLTEHTETERLESAAEHVSQVEQLRPEVWSGLAETERESCLRHVGQKLMESYECPAPPFIGSQMPEVDGGVLLGAYSDSDYMTKLNRELLKENNPSDALETYCHEYRHAYQHEMADRYNSMFRHLCHDETKAAQWAKNFENGKYVKPETDPEGYESQSVEKDAREFARDLKEEVRRRQTE